jgi:hypothetical protein
VYVIILFVGLGIFNIDTAAFLTLSISLWAGTLFAIGGVVKVSRFLFNQIRTSSNQSSSYSLHILTMWEIVL